MSDALFRFLLMAKEHDRFWYRWAFPAGDKLLAAGIERVIDTAAITVDVLVQRERMSIARASCPASERAAIRFYEKAEPHRPKAPVFEHRTEAFPVSGTQSVGRCADCLGLGTVKCEHCEGRGQTRCERCDGHGRFKRALVDGEPRIEDPCHRCGGDGVADCPRCHRRKVVRHDSCAGTGTLLTWDETVFTWWAEKVRETHLPPQGPQDELKKAVEQWVSAVEDSIQELTQEVVAERLGYDSADVALLVESARLTGESVEKRVGAPGERCLFVTKRFRIVPIGACCYRPRPNKAAEEFWLVGRGDRAIELSRPHVGSRWTVGYWGLGFLIADAFHGLYQVSPIAATAGVLGLSLAATELKRALFDRDARVTTLAVLPAANGLRTYLTCLATLGAYVGRLEVVDQTYRAHLEVLMGEAYQAAQSRSVVFRQKGGRLLRLVQVARPSDLSDGEWRRLTRAVDGVVFLEEAADDGAAELQRRVAGVSPALLAAARLQLSQRATDADRNGVTPEGRLAIEAIRRAFVSETRAELDWQAVFDRLWAPVAAVLAR